MTAYDMTQFTPDKLAKDGLWATPINVDWNDLFSNAMEYGGSDSVEVITPTPSEIDLDEYWPDWRDDVTPDDADSMLNEATERFNECDRDWEWRDSFHPTMNFAYPVTLRHNDDPKDVARRVADMAGCVTLIEWNGAHYLALTGGGMDLSWEICAAYVACKVHPPLHFLRDLPRYADKPATAIERIVLGCVKSAADCLRVHADILDRHAVALEGAAA